MNKILKIYIKNNPVFEYVHDPFILRSRDVMKLSDIDGKIII